MKKVWQVHMLTHDEIDEDNPANADLLAEREEEGRSSSTGDEFLLVRAATEDEARQVAEALPEFAGDDWYCDQADDCFPDDCEMTCINDPE